MVPLAHKEACGKIRMHPLSARTHTIPRYSVRVCASSSMPHRSRRVNASLHSSLRKSIGNIPASTAMEAVGTLILVRLTDEPITITH